MRGVRRGFGGGLAPCGVTLSNREVVINERTGRAEGGGWEPKW